MDRLLLYAEWEVSGGGNKVCMLQSPLEENRLVCSSNLRP